MSKQKQERLEHELAGWARPMLLTVLAISAVAAAVALAAPAAATLGVAAAGVAVFSMFSGSSQESVPGA